MIAYSIHNEVSYMRYCLIAISIFSFLHLCGLNSGLRAEGCVSTWTSPDPDQIYLGTRIWQQSLPSDCHAACAKVTITLQVHNYNDAGTLDLYCSNTSTIEYGDPYSAVTAPKLGWIGRIAVPQSFVSPGWKTVSFDLRMPHLEWLNDDGTIFFALEGPFYFSVNAQFQVASTTIESIEANTDLDGDGDTDGKDLSGLIDDMGCSGTCSADFDGDGVVDENDVLDFSDEYGWAGCPLGFYESFDDGFSNGWVVDNLNVWSATDNVYNMTGIQPSPARLRWSYYNKEFDDFGFDVSVKQIQGIQTNAAGIIFRSSPALSSRYEFLISVTGAYTVNKYVGGTFTQLVPWTVSNRIFKGYDEWNRMRVVCTGPSMHLYINGGLTRTLTDSSLPSGRAGVLAVDIDTDTNLFQFDEALLEEQ
jgi:hypothetical protein